MAGRSTILTRNYRNASEVLTRALSVVADDGFDDLDQAREPGSRSVDSDRMGGQVKDAVYPTSEAQRRALIHAVRWSIDNGSRPGDMALLVSSNRAADKWSGILRGEGHEVCSLVDYDGRSSAAIKVGTYHRAKGLEFACVFLPDYGDSLLPSSRAEDARALSDRAELDRRLIFVAMTRARDRLWLGSVDSSRTPSHYPTG